jgi:hypothetical protein
MLRLPKLIAVLALALLMVLTTQALADETKGKIKSVAPDKNQLVMTDSTNKDWTFTVADKAKVTLDGKDCKLADLQAGYEVALTYDRNGDKLIAKEIRAKR